MPLSPGVLLFGMVCGAAAAGAGLAPGQSFALSWMVFAGLWAVLVYFPVAHWVFAFDGVVTKDSVGGWIANNLKAIDFAGGTAVTRRELALAACQVFELDPERVTFGPPPDGARLPAPVPYDTSLSGDATMALLGTRTHTIHEQLAALRREVEQGSPVPLS